jgi:hypothetical protein
MERYTPLAARVRACKKENNFVSGNFTGFSLYILLEGSAKLRWVGRVAHLGRCVDQSGGCSVAQ